MLLRISIKASIFLNKSVYFPIPITCFQEIAELTFLTFSCLLVPLQCSAIMYLLSLLPFLATGLASPLPLSGVVQACTAEQLQQGTCNAAPAPKPLIACRANIDNSNIPSPGLDLGSLPHHVSSVLVPKADFSAALQIPKIVFSNPQQTTVATADATQGTLAPSVGIGNYNDPAGTLQFPTGTVSAAGHDKRGDDDSALEDGMSDYDEDTIDRLLVLLERDEQGKKHPSVDDGEQEPVAHFIETSHTGLESRSSLDLVPRMASSRQIFVGNANYRQTARQQGIIMIEADGPNPGERICIITQQQVNNPLIDEDSIAYAWVRKVPYTILRCLCPQSPSISISLTQKDRNSVLLFIGCATFLERRELTSNLPGR